MTKEDLPKLTKKQLRDKVIKYLKNFGSTKEEKKKIHTKFNNICEKTGQYNVPDQLFQKRTHRKNRVLISWKTVKKNKLTLQQLETFSGGVAVEFVNEDYFQTDDDPQSLFNVLKGRLGSDEIVSSIITIRNEDGSSSSQISRNAFEKLKIELPDYENHLIKRKKPDVKSSGIGNDKWEGYIYYSIKGGQQDTMLSHSKKPFPQLFNPACEFADADICLDIDLVLVYFAMFSIDKNMNESDKKEYDALLNNIKYELKNSEYDNGNLLDYCNNHPCLLLEKGKLFDPIQVEEIKILDFSIDNKKNSSNLDFTHDEAVNKEKYYFDTKKKCILTPSRPNNIFWSRHLSNMMQQNFSLDEYFKREEEIVRKRREKLDIK